MDAQINCPSCGKPIPISEALSHQVKEQLQKEKEEYKTKMVAAFQKRVEEERTKFEKESEEKLKAKLTKQMELQMKEKAEEAEDLAKMVKTLQEQVLEASRQKRQLQQAQEDMKLEMEKKLALEQEKIRVRIKEQSDEEFGLKLAEKDKKIQDAMKLVEEYRRKMEQGSQQTQGEVLELQVEETLKKEFPMDEIREVPKGKLGADLIQLVRGRTGQESGTIVWELKRTKAWSADWIPKLKEDQRHLKAELAVIISEVLPPEVTLFGLKDGVWVGNYQSIVGLAILLRKCLTDVALVRSASTGKKEKMEVMWEYLTSVEFKQRVEAIIEVFSSLQKDIEVERTWFTRKWEKQEKNIRRVIDNTSGMYGSLESIMGKSLPEVEGLSLTSGDIDDDKLFE